MSCGVAFSVADQVANDGLLGSGKYAAGIRVTELRINTDRGTCVAAGITDETFELVRTFYVPFEDGADDVTPVIGRALAVIEEAGRAVKTSARPQLETGGPAEVDELTDLAKVIGGDARMRMQQVLTRLGEHNPEHYGGWSFAALAAMLADHGVTARKSHGIMTVRAADVTAALTRRNTTEEAGEAIGENSPDPHVLPSSSPPQVPALTSENSSQGAREVTASKIPNQAGNSSDSATGEEPSPAPPPTGRREVIRRLSDHLHH
ncbi:hypothetical protein [Amycolatopsis sp. lyj-346]|uniref:hypothetical protein n=1 Tax=Amycolatopsis sp. lyj-346 TaxID=2789289 RepID=UPI00397A8581